MNEIEALDEVLDVTARFVGAAGMLVFAVTSKVFVYEKSKVYRDPPLPPEQVMS